MRNLLPRERYHFEGETRGEEKEDEMGCDGMGALIHRAGDHWGCTPSVRKWKNFINETRWRVLEGLFLYFTSRGGRGRVAPPAHVCVCVGGAISRTTPPDRGGGGSEGRKGGNESCDEYSF